MAEIVVSAIITVLCEKVISGELMKLARSEGIDSQLNKWKKNLPLIQAVLADASQKHITDRAVQLWVNDLQDLAYDIDDVLDDLATEFLRRKLNQEADASTSTSTSTSTGKVLKFFPSCCTNFSPRNIMYGQQMSSKLDEITTRLRDLIDQKNDLGLNMNVNVEGSNRTKRRLEQTSLVDESKIIGREGDKVALLGKLLGNQECDQNVSIVSIVGMGGIGKTTLAKLLYNEEKVKDHFEVRAWVCVSEDCDVFNISKSIFEAVTKENKFFSNIDLLHVALEEKLSKKRFLLVLDDVWNEDHSKWELLQGPLLVGAPGSKVIVTTRSTTVASVMDSVEAYGLKVLSNEDALSLFSQHALVEKNFDKHPTLMLLGEGIVKKCGRLPMALKTLGRVLKENKNFDDWEALLQSEIWDEKDGSDILPALRLSYYHLPPHLKQLFAYCSIIPKDYVFDKNNLVLLWVAEGFLSQSKGKKSMERLGHQYFEELTSRSFFQHSTNDELGYTMHDLINDLATSVAGEFSFRLDGDMDVSDTTETFDRCRHFSLVRPQFGSYRILTELQRAKNLRTLLIMSIGSGSDGLLDKVLHELLPELHFLRVLSFMDLNPNRFIFQGNQIITKIPKSIGSLKHLRYLNFSYTEITCLPEEVSDLYNLQSLLLHRCRKLSSLPRSFAKLINLRQLDVSDTPSLNKMPSGISKLTSLQTLTKVIVEGANGFKISDLRDLVDLHGRLSIFGLDKVINPMQAKDAVLHQKKGLEDLEMKWSDISDDSRNEMIDYEVLNELRPHPKLKNLTILYKGRRFPSWVGDPSFDELTELRLCGSRSTHIPTLGHLRSLTKLVVERMNEVKSVGFELLAPTNSFLGISFPSLEVLKFKDMQGWQSWSISSGDEHGAPRSFPRLHKISITCCPELAEVSIGSIHSLRFLSIKKCSKSVLRSMVGFSSSLVELKMCNIKGLTQLHAEDLVHLGVLERLVILNCEDLRYLWERESEACKSLLSLQNLRVSGCNKLVASAEKDDNFGISMESLKNVKFWGCNTLESYICPSSVETLRILHCYSVRSLSFSTVQELPAKDFGFLPMSCLTSLEIVNCENLKSISHENLPNLLSLKDLWIYFCPSMDYSFPCGLWPPNLKKLTIGGLNKPMSEWGQQNFPTSLLELELNGKNSGGVSFAVAEDVRNTTSTPASSSFLLPPSLVSLILRDFTDAESLSLSEVLQHLPYLKTHHIYKPGTVESWSKAIQTMLERQIC